MTRRAVLAGGLLLPLAACTSTASRPGPSAPPDPDLALRAGAVQREQTLLALYDAALGAPAQGLPPRAVLVGLRAEHAAHLAALLPPSPSSGAPATGTPATAAPTTATPASPPPAPAPGDLRTAEDGAAAAHGDAVVPASRSLAALLATLSAAESAHAVALA